MWSKLLLLSLAHLVSSTPNIIFILNDDWGWSDISIHGSCDFVTPRLDELAKTGLELTNYYVQHLCTPTRSTIMSGRYPIRDGMQQAVINNGAPYGMPLNLTTLPQELKRAGYRTHMIGKWHLGFFRPEYTPTYRGFDTFLGFYGGEEDYFTKNFTENGYNGYDLRNGTQILRDYRYSTYIYGQETMRILEQHVAEEQENPFFIYLPFQAPHAPYQAPDDVVENVPDDITSSNRRLLAAAMSVLDTTIGDIVDYLQSEESGNLWDDTVIVISSDNGGDVDYEASNYPLRGTKGTLFEGAVKAIGIVNGGWLNDERRGTEMNALMHSTDWFVTLQTIAGIEPSVEYILDGLDQTDNFMNGNGADIYTPRQELLHNAHDVAGAVRWRDYKLIKPSDITDGSQDTGLTKKCHSLWCIAGQNTFDPGDYSPSINCWLEDTVHPRMNFSAGCAFNEEFCFFNVRKDPCEFDDRKEEEPEMFAFMVKLYAEYQALQAPALFDLYPEDYDAANPDNFNGTWSSWIGDDANEFTQIAAEETVIMRSRRIGVLQHLLAPSICVLVAVAVVVVALQTVTRFVRRHRKKDAVFDGAYGSV